MIINGVAPTRTALETALQAAADGGVSAFNLTAANQDDYAGAVDWIRRSIATIEGWRGMGGETATVVRDTATLRSLAGDDVVGVILGTQDAAFLEDRTEERVTELYELGVRIVQLTYQRRNAFGSGCGEEIDERLTARGRTLVALLNDAGIAIDLSHVAAGTMRDVIRASGPPPLLTHVNLFELNPLPRNKTVAQVKEIADNGGTVGLTAISRFMKPGGGQSGTDIDDMLDQLQLLIDTVGVGSAGIGLDIKEGMTEEEFAERRKSFFGAFPELMAGDEFDLANYYCRDVSSMTDVPRIADGLTRRGLGADDVAKVMGENFHDYLDRVWR